jgi:alpha-beta hydrolase superfamily lysophospholipase
MTKVIKENVVPLATLVPGLPVGVARLVERLLAKDQAHRHRDAAQLVADIESVFKEPERIPAGTTAKALALAPAAAAGRKPTLLIAGAAGAVVVLCLLAWLLLR